MTEPQGEQQGRSLRQWFSRLSTSKKVIIIVFLIWLVQALPKWTVAITADGELSSQIMRVFIEPRSH